MAKTSNQALPVVYKKSNALISALTTEVTLLAQKIAIIGIQNLRYDDEHDLCVVIKGTDLQKALGVGASTLYPTIKAMVTDALTSWKYVINDPRDKHAIGRFVLIPSAEFIRGNIYLRFNQDLACELINLQNNYTLLPNEIMRLKSTYSFVIYELLLSAYCYQSNVNRRKGPEYVTYDITELKCKLGLIDITDKIILGELISDNPDYKKIAARAKEIGNEKYPENKAFMKWVINRAVSEINEISKTINISVSTTRESRKIKNIVFKVTLVAESEKMKKQVNPDTQTKGKKDTEDEVYVLVSELLNDEFTDEEIRKIADAAQGDKARFINAYKSFWASKSDIKSKVGFMIKAVKEGYNVKEQAKMTRNTKCVNYEGERDYTYEEYEEIEEKLMRRNQAV